MVSLDGFLLTMAGSDEDKSTENERTRAAPVGGSLREVSLDRLGKVLGLVTHDLRNPLAALSSNVGFLQMVGGELSEEIKEAVDDLVLSVEALGRIVDSLELVGHELSDRGPGPASALVVASLIRSVKSPVERGARSHGVRVGFDLGECESLRVWAFEQSFLACLSSLLHNALTVAPSGSTVTLRLSADETHVTFSVEDEGPALAAALRRRAFSAEAQPDIKGDRAARYSRGLGLYAVSRAAQLAGVVVEVAERESGSRISLVAPLALGGPK